MGISFTAIAVGSLLDAARLVTRPADIVKDPDQVDALIHRNADAHMDQPRNAVINVASAIADRIQEVLAAAAPPVPPVESSTDAGSGSGVSVETVTGATLTTTQDLSDPTKLSAQTDLAPEPRPEPTPAEPAPEQPAEPETEETTAKRRR